VQQSKVRLAQTHHLVWFLTLMALLAVLCISGCGGGSEDEALSTAPHTPSVDPRQLIQSAPASAPSR
jgi:hypothetical protein